MHVPGVDIAQPGFSSHIRRTDEGLQGRILVLGHFIITMIGGHMPGDIGGNGCQKTGNLPQLRVCVVEAGHDQCDDFDP